MHVIRIGDKEYKAPSAWKEMSAADLLYLGQISCLSVQNEITTYFTVLRLFRIPAPVFKKLLPVQRLQLKSLVDWVFDKNNLETWLLKAVKAGTKQLFGPENQLADLTAEEFIYTEAAYERWLDTEDKQWLDTLFAVLYRPKGFFSRKRVLFNQDNLLAGEKMAQKIKLQVKRAVALNYAGCRNGIIDRHPSIWRVAGEAIEDAPPSAPGLTPWMDIILNLSGKKFGTWEQTLKTKISVILRDLDREIADSKPKRKKEGEQ